MHASQAVYTAVTCNYPPPHTHTQRSFSFSRENPSPAHKYRIAGTPKEKEKNLVRKRSSKRSKVGKQHLPSNWVDVIGPDVGEKFSKEQIKRQEVGVDGVCVWVGSIAGGYRNPRHNYFGFGHFITEVAFVEGGIKLYAVHFETWVPGFYIYSWPFCR